MLESIEDRIKNLILKLYQNASDDFGNDTLILDNGIIDSLGIINLIIEIENCFEVKIYDSELIYENFKTINSIKQLIMNKYEN